MLVVTLGDALLDVIVRLGEPLSAGADALAITETAAGGQAANVAAWSVALGSGTSGGVLAPLLIMGGGLGALESSLLPVGDAGLWATVSMAALASTPTTWPPLRSASRAA